MGQQAKVYFLDTALPSQRELARQLIDVRLREDMQKRENVRLKAENTRLKAELKHGSQSVLKKRLDHAVRQLANCKSAWLSDEEWAVIREMRGQCS